MYSVVPNDNREELYSWILSGPNNRSGSFYGVLCEYKPIFGFAGKHLRFEIDFMFYSILILVERFWSSAILGGSLNNIITN
ncbi:hypothetical protein TorRG33x02_339260 [Trema orientale]|uniref:Uncharacterized protein n=1 Tax=Trema orientale TaxID=63057 RepID=A0A2P5AWN3_TREOI|nr:hypothetical protein TorRG33x02_339260 [Trema orientale]